MFEMITTKMGTRSETTHSQLPSSKQLWCVKTTIKQDKTAIRGSQCAIDFSFELGQVGTYMQSVCNNAEINCDKSQICGCLLPSISDV